MTNDTRYDAIVDATRETDEDARTFRTIGEALAFLVRRSGHEHS